ncbi:MAG: division/cell wall cluster transcriptional repressor MraZ [Bacteroidales bacterium]|nr:division/cell wall cluster transcriptional repressor MraZ [Bacteroidales bacterium]
MAIRFIGDYGAKADAKGRVFLPASFRKMLESEGEKSLVLRSDVFQKCLVLYPQSVWNAQVDELRSRVNPFNPKQVNHLRMFQTGTDQVELDSNGRLLISKRMLQYAGIEGEVRFLAMMDRIEIWSKQVLDDLVANSGDLGEELEATFGQMSL